MKTINMSVLLLCLFFSGLCVHAADSVTPFAGIASKPAIAVKIDGTTPLAGGPISTTPKVEITVTTVNGLTLGRLKVGSTAVNLTFVNVGNNYYATSEISTPLS